MVSTRPHNKALDGLPVALSHTEKLILELGHSSALNVAIVFQFGLEYVFDVPI